MASCKSAHVHRSLWPAGEVLADVSLVWKNCHTFNAAGSEINQLCDDTQAAFDQRWQQGGLPVSKSGKPRAEPRRRKPKPTAAAPDRPTRRSAAQPAHDDAADGGDLSVEQHLNGKEPRACRHMGRASGDRGDAAGRSQQQGGEGQGPVRAHGKAPKRMRSLSELPSEPDPAELQRKPKKRKGQAADGGGSELEGPLATALGVVKGMLKVKAAAPFTRPVLESQVPGYHQVVKKPMDLTTVRDSIQEGLYTDTGE